MSNHELTLVGLHEFSKKYFCELYPNRGFNDLSINDDLIEKGIESIAILQYIDAIERYYSVTVSIEMFSMSGYIFSVENLFAALQNHN